MEDKAENCAHPEGVWVLGSLEFQCPACRTLLDRRDVESWVRDTEGVRYEAHSAVEGNGVAEIVYEERQREVYRRRKVLYELRNVPRMVAAHPVMIQDTYAAGGDA